MEKISIITCDELIAVSQAYVYSDKITKEIDITTYKLSNRDYKLEISVDIYNISSTPSRTEIESKIIGILDKADLIRRENGRIYLRNSKTLF